MPRWAIRAVLRVKPTTQPCGAVVVLARPFTGQADTEVIWMSAAAA